MIRKKQILTFENSNKQVIYLMTKSFRIRNNYTLFEALNEAKANFASLIVYIVQPVEENARNISFFRNMTQDLPDKLDNIIDKAVFINRNEVFNLDLDNIGSVYIDKAYLREDRIYLENIVKLLEAKKINLSEVDSNVFQPSELVSQKEEYSARTIRDKIWKLFLQPLVLMNEDICLGENTAMSLLNRFINKSLKKYDQRNDPSLNLLSGLSPFLKYGFISPNVVYDIVKRTDILNSDAFLEELIVRRELAYNYVLFNRDYDKFKHMTYQWAYQTMSAHLYDGRKYIYSVDDYINFKTHDIYFNTAMKEMIYFGRMHSYMRMYWCKKIIEWSMDYETAYKIAIYLNNYYFLDGNTPNGYAGVAWCFGKHDRAWAERPIFGKLRYMNMNGLKRKFDIDKYVENIEREIKGGNN